MFFLAIRIHQLLVIFLKINLFINSYNTGTFCETEMNYCASQPCMNGGLCSNNVEVGLQDNINSNKTNDNQLPFPNILNKKFNCNCPAEFEGTQCEVGENKRIT